MKQTVLAGLSLLALCGTASAADLSARMPVKAPAAAPLSATPSWAGFYIGGHVGYGWNDTETTIVTGTPTFPEGFVINSKPKGWLGGGQAG